VQVNNLRNLADLAPIQVWDSVVARRVEGERITLAVVELAPDSVAPEHRHPSEQLGICLKGALSFRVGEETRDVGPGGTWRILGDVPHEVHVGPEGAVVIDVFSPVRMDWDALPMAERAPPAWPGHTDGG